MSRFFVHKALLSGAGMVIGLFGMATAQRWCVWVAVALLGIAFLFRFVERRRQPAPLDSR